MQRKQASVKLRMDAGSLSVAFSPRQSRRDSGAPQLKTVSAVCETGGIQERSSVVTWPEMCPDAATLHWFWNETRNRLESLRHRVREGRDLMEAADFCRYVLNSGLLKVLAVHDCQGELKVDSSFLAWSAADLLREVQELWRTQKAPSEASRTQLEAILHRLDLIAGRVAKIPIPDNPARLGQESLSHLRVHPRARG